MNVDLNLTAMRYVTEIEDHAERSETTGRACAKQRRAPGSLSRAPLAATAARRDPNRRPVDRRSRIQRWDDATNALLGIQAECVNWLEALPDSLRSTAMAEALETIADLDLSALAEVKPPRGYGRD